MALSARTRLRGRVLSRFPANVVAGDGITITKSNGVYTITGDFGATSGAFDGAFGSTPGFFLKRGSLTWAGGTIIGSDLPVPTTIDRGGVFSLPVSSNSVLSGIDATGTPTLATTTGTGNVVRSVSPTITGGAIINSLAISGSGASSTLTINGSLFANNDGTNTKVYTPTAGLDIYNSTGVSLRERFLDAGGIAYSGSSSGTHTVVAPAAAGSATSTWPTTTGTIVNTGADATVIAAMRAKLGFGAILGGYAIGVDFNAVADTQITLTMPTGVTHWRWNQFQIFNTGTTASLTTAQYGVFTAATGGGVALIASGSVMTSITSNTVNSDRNSLSGAFAVNAANTFNYSSLFFRITQAQGAAATGNVYIFLTPVPTT